MLDQLSKQRVFGSDDQLDHFDKVNWLNIDSVQDPGKLFREIVAVENNFQAASEHWLVENVLVDQRLKNPKDWKQINENNLHDLK